MRGKHIIGPTFARGREPLGKSIHKFDRRATKNEMKKTILGKRKICFPHVQVDGRASEGESANLDHLWHRERFSIDLLCKQILLFNKSKTTFV